MAAALHAAVRRIKRNGRVSPGCAKELVGDSRCSATPSFSPSPSFFLLASSALATLPRRASRLEALEPVAEVQRELRAAHRYEASDAIVAGVTRPTRAFADEDAHLLTVDPRSVSNTPLTDPDDNCVNVIGGRVSGNGRFCIINRDITMTEVEHPIITHTIRINTPNVTFDCANNLFAPVASANAASEQHAGVTVRGTADNPADNVRVQNCRFYGFKVAARPENPAPAAAREEAVAQRNWEIAWAYAPSGVVFDHIVALRNGRQAFALGPWTHATTVQNSVVKDGATMGVYFSSNSGRHRVIGNRFINNGYGRNREGMSVDASSRNVIAGNLFLGNNLAGIYLYKNCQEHAQTIDPNYNPNSETRHQHAERTRD